MPKLEMPGALICGDGGSILNVPKIKGVHQAIRCAHSPQSTSPRPARARASRRVARLAGWLGAAQGAQFQTGVQEGPVVGTRKWRARDAHRWAHAVDTEEHRRCARAPATRRVRLPDRHWTADRALKPRDRLAAVYFAGTTHDEAQPVHLKVSDLSICVDRCTREFGNPCQNFCPAGVYEMVSDAGAGRRLQINASNCVHCKACDIKDPYDLITWTTPEGGSGPNYPNL